MNSRKIKQEKVNLGIISFSYANNLYSIQSSKTFVNLDQTETISALLPSVNISVSCAFRFILPYWAARDPSLPLTSNIFLANILEIVYILTPV